MASAATASAAASAAEIVHPFTSSHRTYTTLRAKVIVAGDACVGKSALLKCLLSKGADYPKTYVQTTQFELMSHIIRLHPAAASDAPAGPRAHPRVELMLLDAPGGAVYNQREGNARVWESASMIAVVFDVGNRESFSSVGRWLRRAQDARAAADSHARPITGVIIGAKSDFRDPTVDRAEVSESEARAFAESLRMGYFEVSSERGADVEKPFEYLAQKFNEMYEADMARIESL